MKQYPILINFSRLILTAVCTSLCLVSCERSEEDLKTAVDPYTIIVDKKWEYSDSKGNGFKAEFKSDGRAYKLESGVKGCHWLIDRDGKLWCLWGGGGWTTLQLNGKSQDEFIGKSKKGYDCKLVRIE